MSEYRKRSTKRRKQKEATLVGDLFKILFAVSMLIVAILVAFFVFKNVSGFQLPDLRVTVAETSVSETPVVVSIAKKEETTAETSAAVRVTESAEVSSEADSEEAELEKKIESVEASVEESVQSSEEEAKKESEAEEQKETKSTQETKESRHTDKVEELPSKETEKGPTPGAGSQGEISNGPVAGADAEKEGPVMPEKDGAIISEAGPVAG